MDFILNCLLGDKSGLEDLGSRPVTEQLKFRFGCYIMMQVLYFTTLQRKKKKAIFTVSDEPNQTCPHTHVVAISDYKYKLQLNTQNTVGLATGAVVHISDLFNLTLPLPTLKHRINAVPKPDQRKIWLVKIVWANKI